MRRIFVTAISGDISNGILKILNENKEEVYGCDIYKYPVGLDGVKKFWQIKPAKHSGYIGELLDICIENRITHLIPANEVELKVISQNRLKFEESGIKLLINSDEIITNFLDKYKTYDYLKGIKGITVPKTYSYDEFKEDGNKYVAKLRVSCGSKFLHIIQSKKDLEKLQCNMEDFIIQEYIGNESSEYTVGVFSNGDKIETIIFKRELKNGYSSLVELVRDIEIEEIAKKIAKSIKLRGYINIQLRKERDKNYIFEINPRISGTVRFRYLLGFQDVLWWLDLLDGTLELDYFCRVNKAIGVRELNEKFIYME